MQIVKEKSSFKLRKHSYHSGKVYETSFRRQTVISIWGDKSLVLFSNTNSLSFCELFGIKPVGAQQMLSVNT